VKTVQLLTRETPDFIALTLGPVNSPDLNPVDYRICWEKPQERVYRSRIHDVVHLELRLIEEWKHLNQVNNWSSKQSGIDLHVFKFAFERVDDILKTDFKCV